MTSRDDEVSINNPAEALRLIEREQAHVERELTPDPRLMLWPWGLAWLLGAGLFFLRWGPDGRALVALPAWLPITVLTALIIAAGVITAVVGVRSGRQVAGASSKQGTMYSFAWAAGFTGISLVLANVSELVPAERQGLLWGGSMAALTGALYMAGGAIWPNREMFALGAWISAANIVGVLFGPGWHSLIVALAGGGGMLLAGLVGWLRLR